MVKKPELQYDFREFRNVLFPTVPFPKYPPVETLGDADTELELDRAWAASGMLDISSKLIGDDFARAASFEGEAV